VLLAIGSGGIGGLSRTGSGGAGGRPPVVSVAPGGGGTGRATGGFFFEQAVTVTASSNAVITADARRMCMLSVSFSNQAAPSTGARLGSIPTSVAPSGCRLLTVDYRLSYCDQLGYRFRPCFVT
jgi:hypothetical protein